MKNGMSIVLKINNISGARHADKIFLRNDSFGILHSTTSTRGSKVFINVTGVTRMTDITDKSSHDIVYLATKL